MSMLYFGKDFVEPSNDNATAPAGGPVTDIVLFFCGWAGGANGGKRFDLKLDPDKGPFNDLVERVRQIPRQAARQLEVGAWFGAVSHLSDGPPEAVRLVSEKFHPEGRLIVYGYSAGGNSAFDTVKRMRELYYNGSSGRCEWANRPGTVGTPRVDLWISIDAYGVGESVTQHIVPRCVKTCVNYYQMLNAGGTGAHGYPYRAEDAALTTIHNYDLSERYQADPGNGHYRIDDETYDTSFKLIRDSLSFLTEPLPLTPPGTQAA